MESSEFRAFAKKHLSESDVFKIVEILANNPEIGDIIPGSGGLRKFRFARDGKGKSGGFRIIHYYHDSSIPVFLITGFAKNEMENLSKAFYNHYQKLLPIIIEKYKNKGKK
ncbi:MAG: type II toxin-antitoxin system RelE/ParE family toxin [Rickettsiales bacterium]